MDPKKKILILYTSVGMGHKFIGENIGWHLSASGFEVRLEDIGKVQEGKFSNSVICVHQFINKYLPFVWSFLYKWGHYIILPFRVFIAGFNYKQTKKIVDEFKPDLIITVQTSASAVIAFLKKKGLYQGPFGIAFSDFHLHRYWLYKQADFYLANIQEQKEEMLKYGIAPEKIFICGITLKPKPAIDAAQVKNKLGISPREKVILLSSGSLGSGIDPDLIKKFLALPNTKLIVVCGKNEKIYQQLKNQYHNPRLIIFGFYKFLDELYAISDIFVTKPGGLTTAEALRWHLPMIVSHWLPGQEELNILYLSERKLIILAKPTEALSVRTTPKASADDPLYMSPTKRSGHERRWVKTGLIEAAVQELNTQNFRKSLENNLNLKAILEPQDSPKEAVLKMLNLKEKGFNL